MSLSSLEDTLNAVSLCGLAGFGAHTLFQVRRGPLTTSIKDRARKILARALQAAGDEARTGADVKEAQAAVEASSATPAVCAFDADLDCQRTGGLGSPRR